MLILAFTFPFDTLCLGQKILNVLPEAQETSYWCCFASAVMIMKYHHVTVTQCDEASSSLKQQCCNKPLPSSCLNSGWPEFHKYRFNYTPTSNNSLSWPDVQNQIDQSQPMAFSWHWNRGGGHMMVLIGYKVQNGIQYVLINDPDIQKAQRQYWITFDDYVSGTDHSHWNDYYDIK